MSSPTQNSNTHEIYHDGRYSQVPTNPKGDLDFIHLSRPWPSSLAPFPCFDGSCKPPELCTHCYLRYSAKLPTLASEKDSFHASPQYASFMPLESSSASTPQGAQSMTTPALFQQAYTDPGHLYVEAPATYAENLTPMEKFVSEPMTSQPYNVVYSFASLPAKSQADISTLAATCKQYDSSSAHDMRCNTQPRSRRSHAMEKNHRTT